MKNATVTYRNESDSIVATGAVGANMPLSEIVKNNPLKETLSCDIEFENEKYFDRFAMSFRQGFLSKNYEVHGPAITHQYYFDIEELSKHCNSEKQRQRIAQLIGEKLSEHGQEIMTLFNCSDIGVGVAYDDYNPFTNLTQNLIAKYYIGEGLSILSIFIMSIGVGTHEQIGKRLLLTVADVYNNIKAMDKIIDKLVASLNLNAA